MQNKRVLVVDDDPRIAQLLAQSLHSISGQTIVETAHSELDAREKLETEFYQLVITDHKMPGLNGFDLAAAVRGLSPATQVVLMTTDQNTSAEEKVKELRLDGYIAKPFTLERIREIVEDVLSTTEGEDPYRTGELHVDGEAQTYLQGLLEDTGARCVMLLSAGGYPVEVAGMTDDFDVNATCTLIAANFTAAVELSKLLGNTSIFKSSYHEGPDYNIYAYDVNGDLLLAVIFGSETKTGVVWFFTKQAAMALAKLNLNQPQDCDFADGDLTTSFDVEFAAAFAVETSHMGAQAPNVVPDNTLHLDVEMESQSGRLMSLEDAIAAGIVPADLGN